MPAIEVRDLGFGGCLEIRPPCFADDRGAFTESWNAAAWADAGIDIAFVQDNHSRSKKGVLRGLHYQVEPAAHAKAVRVLRGSIFDVAVDIRRSSPTFGKWYGTVLEPWDNRQILIPEGFAHGFLALVDDSEIAYKVSGPYSAAHDRSIRFDDPELAIEWPDLGVPPLLSEKDRNAPLLRDAELFA